MAYGLRSVFAMTRTGAAVVDHTVRQASTEDITTAVQSMIAPRAAGILRWWRRR